MKTCLNCKRTLPRVPIEGPRNSWKMDWCVVCAPWIWRDLVAGGDRSDTVTLRFQEDGNLVVYREKEAVWDAGLRSKDVAHKIATDALKDIAAGRPELDEWGDADPMKIAKKALRQMKASVKKS